MSAEPEAPEPHVISLEDVLGDVLTPNQQEILGTRTSSPPPDRQAAVDPTSPPTLQERLAASSDHLVRFALAGNVGLYGHVQEALARDVDVSVVLHLAGNPSLAPSLQDRFAEHGDPRVRAVLAANHQTSPRIQRALTQDDSVMVRTALAANPFLALSAQVLLGSDPDRSVRSVLAQNASLVPSLELPADFCAEHAPYLVVEAARAAEVGVEEAQAAALRWSGELSDLVEHLRRTRGETIPEHSDPLGTDDLEGEA